MEGANPILIYLGIYGPMKTPSPLERGLEEKTLVTGDKSKKLEFQTVVSRWLIVDIPKFHRRDKKDC